MSLYTFVRWGRSRTRVKGIKWASSRGLLVASHRDWYRRDAVQHHTACDNASLDYGREMHYQPFGPCTSQCSAACQQQHAVTLT